jgi:hypothetical protein
MPHDGASPESEMDIVKLYQRAVGGLNLLATITRPDLCIYQPFLTQFSHNPSEKHTWRPENTFYTISQKGTPRRVESNLFRILAYQTPSLTGLCRPSSSSKCVAFNDANWGQQDSRTHHTHPMAGPFTSA